ncbi:MAG: hypothetical protein ORN49_03820, partial [Rhodobacteraceae bacterium]|nr:hypothetical protein [Paracoccaceae bacterium]
MSFLRPATAADLPALTDFLHARLDQAMFALSNLTTHGLGDQKPQQMRFWLHESGDKVQGILGLSGDGVAFPLFSSPDPGHWPLAAEILAGLKLTGLIAPPEDVAGLYHAITPDPWPAERDSTEPGFILDLAALTPPATTSFRLHRPTEADRPLMQVWRAQYVSEVLGVPAARADDVAAGQVDGFLARDSHRLLLRDGVAVAMTGFNAHLPDCVQIGG